MPRALPIVLIAGLALGCEGDPTRPPPERAASIDRTVTSPAADLLRDAFVPHLLDGLSDPAVREARAAQIEWAALAVQQGEAASLGRALARSPEAELDEPDAIAGAALDLVLRHAAELAAAEPR